MKNKQLQELDLKLPPTDKEMEEVVLGTFLIENAIMDEFAGEFSSNLFFYANHKIIAEAMITMYKNDIPIDIITLVSQLRKEGKLESVGGAYFITSLCNRVCSSANVETHIRILQQEALRRTIIQSSSLALRNAYDETQDVFELHSQSLLSLDNAMKQILNYQIKNVASIHLDIIETSKKIAESGMRSGVPTGLRMLDNVTNGWQKSDLIILAGRPSMGKTAAAISMSIYPAIEKNKCVGVFSLEMSAQQLVSRMQSYFSEVNVSRIVKKQLGYSEIEEITNKAKVLESAPLFIDDTPNISLIDLKGKARKLVREHNCELIIIDYLQLMRSTTKTYSREQEIAEISRGLKGLAKELDIPVLALSQLSRGVESRGGDKKPMLQDLRESGQIEQDADMVIFCYRPEYYQIEEYSVGDDDFETKGLFMLLIAKHRNGELGEIPLTFIHELAKVTNHKTYGNNYELDDNSITFVQEQSNTLQSEFNSDSNSDLFDGDSDNPPF